MPVKLNNYILPDSIIQKMRDKVEYSRSDSVEAGFDFCTDNTKNLHAKNIYTRNRHTKDRHVKNHNVKNHQLHDENHCTGTQCMIETAKGCKQGNYVGGFHTHPNESSNPSIQDIAIAYLNGIECIGGTDDKNIKCYIRNDFVATEKNLDIIIDARTRYEDSLNLPGISHREHAEKHEKYTKVTNERKKHYLNIVNI